MLSRHSVKSARSPGISQASPAPERRARLYLKGHDAAGYFIAIHDVDVGVAANVILCGNLLHDKVSRLEDLLNFAHPGLALKALAWSPLPFER